MNAKNVDLEIFDTEATFQSLGLNDKILKGVEAAGFSHPTVIQSTLIPQSLEGHDILGQSRTGSGKTAAFGLPALHLIQKEDSFILKKYLRIF